MMSWRDDWLLWAILWWTALVTAVLIWLPLIRGATQGVAYPWRLDSRIGGRGMGGDYWLLVVIGAFVFILLYLGWRGAPQPFHWLLVLFHLPLSAAVVYRAWTHPEDFRFEGATIGVNFSLAQIGPVLFGGFTILAILWVARDLKTRPRRALVPWTWTRATQIRLILVLAAVPMELVLFRTGGIQSMRNVIGVGLIFWQWLLINRVLASSRALDGRSPS